MKRDSSDAQVPQHQRHPLGVVARAAENDERVTGQLIKDGHQVTVLRWNKHGFRFKRGKQKDIKRT